MSLQNVIRKDLLDVRRANVVRGVGVVYLAFTMLFFYGVGSGTNTQVLSNQLYGMAILGVLIIPLVALVAAYLSVAGERESGSLKFLLSYPNNRRDVVFGKFVARSAVVTASIILAYVVGLAMALFYFDTVEMATYAGFVLLTILFALVYVSIAVGISAATSSRSRAMGLAIGSWFILNVFWNFLPVNPAQIVNFVTEKIGVELSDAVLQFITSISPTAAYLITLDLVLEQNPATGKGFEGMGGIPDVWYLTPEFMFVILAFWFVAPLLLGYWRFERADLG
ncbi:ABC transporter permease subunit [Haloarchaeobius sp. DFWS5]|uniref:ABC transporter permease subunit n=1 Tax=Haloarchaeobius sp. DFWS5 TaxID=3446114 RepID=UPI003EBCF807